ncbi:ATP synthase subunit C lysine N-methyltransferase isoform X1 [Thunnus thynnus]|uniref:ATP synthase subunit C lysine N-methyltransferase isoform X1 n=1 Tax=Thunnus thynnus TaxID=8237 RepID=UPI0035292FD0
MEDSIEMVLQEYGRVLPTTRPHPVLSAGTGVLLTGLYGVWSLFAMPGFRKVPLNLKKVTSTVRARWTRKYDDQEQIISSLVPYLPSSKDQTLNTMKLLEGRTGRLADLGSGDGRLVFAASSAGFQCTGFEINSILLAYARRKAQWTGVPSSQATFVKKDFWKTDLSKYNNVTAFLAPGVMEALGEKLMKELPDDARVVACRFPFPDWPHQSSAGSGLDQTWAYDMSTVRSSLRNMSSTMV